MDMKAVYEKYKVGESYGNIITIFDTHSPSFYRIKTNHSAAVCRDFFSIGGSFMVIEKRIARCCIFKSLAGTIYVSPMDTTLASDRFAKLISANMRYKYFAMPDTSDNNYIFICAINNLMTHVQQARAQFNALDFVASLCSASNNLPSN